MLQEIGVGTNWSAKPNFSLPLRRWMHVLAKPNHRLPATTAPPSSLRPHLLLFALPPTTRRKEPPATARLQMIALLIANTSFDRGPEPSDKPTQYILTGERTVRQIALAWVGCSFNLDKPLQPQPSIFPIVIIHDPVEADTPVTCRNPVSRFVLLSSFVCCICSVEIWSCNQEARSIVLTCKAGSGAATSAGLMRPVFECLRTNM